MPVVKLSSLNQNLELYYEIHGKGDIKILFIMGLLTEGIAWYRQTEFFAEQSDYQCVHYDNRGFGQSSSPLTIHYSTYQMAKDALALIDHLHWNKCHVVGLSMGGMIALELALLAPERLLSLTLLATHAGGFASRAPFVGIRHLIQSFCLRDEHLLIENILSMLYSTKTLSNNKKRKSLYDYYLARIRKRVRISLFGAIGQIIATQRHYISYADLLKIRYAKFKSLIIVGTEDRLVREANSYMIRRILGCRLIKFDDAGHGLQIEWPDEINEELLKFFESVRNKESHREIPNEYPIEMNALKQACQHRTHCFVYDIVGFCQGVVFGFILCNLLLIMGITKIELMNIHLNYQFMILFGCLNGLRRSIRCVFKRFRVRHYIRQHRLELDRAAHHGGVGIALPDESKHGIPYGCGFDIPILPLIVMINLISLIYWMNTLMY